MQCRLNLPGDITTPNLALRVGLLLAAAWGFAARVTR